ncbi:MAG TPA: nuclear transport factor 2 family protein [Acidimicrobiales bacterium]|nr:nuclear transport factor 2 family protein [Acidimicrobiales bacterium]
MDARQAVQEYLEAMPAQEWDRVAAVLADEGVVRDGPFVDVIEGKQAYVDFLRGIIAKLPDYHLDVERITPDGDGRFFVELHEIFDSDQGHHDYPEILLFGTNPAGLIDYVSVFMKFPGMDAPIEGGSAAT